MESTFQVFNPNLPSMSRSPLHRVVSQYLPVIIPHTEYKVVTLVKVLVLTPQ